MVPDYQVNGQRLRTVPFDELLSAVINTSV